MIGPFEGDYRFLSNFYDSPFYFGGLTYPTAEHFYQSMKAVDQAGYLVVMRCATPGQAKIAGRNVVMRPDWDQVKKLIMMEAVLSKFSQNGILQKWLVDTGTEHLEEVNTWGDRYWGTVGGVGENWLGRILMMVRDVLA